MKRLTRVFLWRDGTPVGRQCPCDEPQPFPLHGYERLYIPQNHDRQFKGWVSVRTALGASLNVPAVRTLVMVSPDAFHQPLTNAYRAPGPCTVDPRAAFIVSDILADSNGRARTFGNDSVLATRFWSAATTGTSKDMQDNWGGPV